MQTAELWGLPSPDYHAEFYQDVPTKRLIAFLIDSVMIFLISAVFVVLSGFLGLFVWPLLIGTVSFLYRTATLARSSATPGMWLTSLEMRTFRGERFDLMTAAAHTAIFTAMFAMVVPQVISVAMMLMTPRRQGLADMLLGTAALNRAAAR
jgi:uncharacterized RDD family membrane protein YckC